VLSKYRRRAVSGHHRAEKPASPVAPSVDVEPPEIIPGNETEIPPLPRTVDSDVAAGAVAGLLNSEASPEEVEEVVSFVAAVPLGVRRTAPRWVAPFFTAAAVCTLPWVIYLGFELPERSTSQHYNLAWVGFDVFLVIAMARTALFAWQGRRQVQLPAVATATLLIVDAWFDILTSSGGALLQALLFAFLLELPLAATAMYIARNVDRVVERAEHRLAQQAQSLLATHLLSGSRERES
jgi:hypothetical protein